MKGYYFITDEQYSAAGIISDVEKAVSAGVKIIQYRNKKAETRRMYTEALVIKDLCAGTGSRLIINDRIDIALAVDADGVHIGQDDMPYGEARRLLGNDKIIGVTVHNVSETREAVGWGADYLGVSPIFATGTKADAGAPCGTGILAEIRQACKIPLVAIGGIDLDNVDAVIDAGADMVCAISSVITKHDVAGEILKFQRKFGI
jgi:thiamine-phosphate pyrophosphorylase